jgi:hypothetical protein
MGKKTPMFKLPNYFKESFTMYYLIQSSTRHLQATLLMHMDKDFFVSYLAQFQNRVTFRKQDTQVTRKAVLVTYYHEAEMTL